METNGHKIQPRDPSGLARHQLELAAAVSDFFHNPRYARVGATSFYNLPQHARELLVTGYAALEGDLCFPSGDHRIYVCNTTNSGVASGRRKAPTTTTTNHNLLVRQRSLRPYSLSNNRHHRYLLQHRRQRHRQRQQERQK